MARLTVHTHGVPKEKAMKHLIEMYGERLKGRGVSVEHLSLIHISESTRPY